MNQATCGRCGHHVNQADLILAKLCQNCFNSLLSSRDEILSDSLEALHRPAALFSSNLVALFVNSYLCRTLGMFPHDIVGNTIGSILKCVYTPSLGLCGETVCCFLCELKRVFELSTKERTHWKVDFHRKPGILMQMRVETEKAGDAILFMMGDEALSVRP